MKSTGVTPSERRIAKLCDKTFLRLWSYANLYRQPEKELCDILAVFKNEYIIFSDKFVKFDNTKSVKLAWDRWYRKSILESASQALGARRWLLKHSSSLFIDRACTQQFSLVAETPTEDHIHLVLIVHNIAEACQTHLKDRTSLSIINQHSPSQIFSINQFVFDGVFIHIFDGQSIELLLAELDTAQDFIAYLRERMRLLTSTDFQYARSEEELLTYYLSHCEGGKHSFASSGQINLKEERAQQYWTSSAYYEKTNEDRISYVWDSLIESITEDTKILRGQPDPTRIPINESNLSSFLGIELAMRVPAGESRFARRYLSKILLEFYELSRGNNKRARIVQSQEQSGVVYVFLVYRQKPGQPYEAYRHERAIYLRDYCLAARSHFQDMTRWLGIVSEPAGAPGSSLELLLIEQPSIDDEFLKQSRILRKAMGILSNTLITRTTEDEYPHGSGTTQYGPDDLRRVRNRMKATRRGKKRR